MFPYPSGAGLHVGHPEGYTATDILTRYRRACGFNVLHPMGWDAFGLPAEQYAIKTGQHPRKTTEANIATFKRQIKSLGFATTGPAKWTPPTPNISGGPSGFFLSSTIRGLIRNKKAEPVEIARRRHVGTPTAPGLGEDGHLASPHSNGWLARQLQSASKNATRLEIESPRLCQRTTRLVV